MPRMSPERRAEAASDAEVVRELLNLTARMSLLTSSTQGEIERALRSALSALESLGQEPAVTAKALEVERWYVQQHDFAPRLGRGLERACVHCSRPESEHKPKGERP